MSREEGRNLTRVGGVVALALVALALGVVGITSRQGLFERKAEYFSIFPDAAGLKEGAGVWLQGVEVGYVDGLEFDESTEAPRVIVHYRIRATLVPRIRSNTRASINTLGLLGDKYISLGTPAGKGPDEVNILPGGQIPADPAINLEALGRGAQDVLQNTVALSHNLNVLMEKVNGGGSVVSRLLNDPKMGQETGDHIASISKSLDTIAATTARGEGLAGKVLMDGAYGESVSRDLAQSLSRANAILTDLQAGQGAAGALLAEGGGGQKLVEDLGKAAAGLALAAESLQKPGTLGNRLFVDEVYGEELAQNLLSISASLDSILKKVDRGEGTLGALVNDRSVYDSLAASVEGMQQSGVVKWYLEKKAEDAAKAAKAADEKKGK